MPLMNINQIKTYLPHRYPFLFVDAVDELVPGEFIKARKSVTANEQLFLGHFPGNPVLPGVIQIEAMAQTGCLLAIMSGAKIDKENSVYIANIDECKFRRPVLPGDVLLLSSKIVRHKMRIWKLACEAHVGDQLASSAVITATTSAAATMAEELPDTFPKPGFSAD
ncbi:MAG: 3-hydroxyacyl-ACP dehydratase FabZ [Myxococcota bacterium]